MIRKNIGQCRFAKVAWFHTMFIGMLLSGCGSNVPPELVQTFDALPDRIDFNFHVRPILSDRCYACHGPDDNTREADLRLDQEQHAFANLASGGRAIVRGDLDRSKIWQRILSDDPERMMPPPKSHLVLSAEEKAIIGKWIEQGAEWKEHWAFIPPEKKQVPSIADPWVINEVDQFILRKLKSNGLQPSSEAGKEQLIRRLTLDLTGLPPSIVDTEQFLADQSPTAYERVVDRLLQSTAHAEHLTVGWLDVARYGDTQGLHTDAERRYWPWRDWAIKAFLRNLSYDQFILWQMAGDLLPDATPEQKLATAFHRLHPMSSEGGIPNEEFRQKYVMDRTNTTATTFLGLTLECASCHDHKFDPISQQEYYEMSAFFNQLDELGLVNESTVDDPSLRTKHSSGPVILLPDSLQDHMLASIDRRLEEVKVERSQLEKSLTADYIQSLPQTDALTKPIRTVALEKISSHPIKDGVVHRIQNNLPINQVVDNDRRSLACGNLKVVEGKVGAGLRSEEEMDIVFLKEVGDIEMYEALSVGAWIRTEKQGENQTIVGNSGAMGNGWRGWDFYIDSLNRPALKLVSMLPHNYLEVVANEKVKVDQWHHLFFTYDGSGEATGVALYLDGRKLDVWIRHDELYGTIKRRWRVRSEWPTRPLMVFRSGRYHTGENGVFKGSIDQLHFFDQCISAFEVARWYEQESGQQIKEDMHWADHVQMHHLEKSPLHAERRELLRQKVELIKEVPDMMVLEDRVQPRPTFVLDRGQYDQPLQQVFPTTPRVLGEFSKELPRNRLGLAKWMVDAANPLTARVAVNRYWQMLFGAGMVSTPHDFGVQGALPSHPDLLDWLAITFIESGWDLRALLKKLVMSRTYRQQSVPDPTHVEKDPDNRLLARAPSYRWPAETIRDHALAVSGLLVHQLGGPSVKPHQPDGIWDFGSLVTGPYEVGTGNDLYRRSMYTYIRRTSPHPSMVAFDAPDRLLCTAKREQTNTPLQALVLLNDPQYVEASMALAERMSNEGGADVTDQLKFGFRLVTSRFPSEKELGILTKHFSSSLSRFKQNSEETSSFLASGTLADRPSSEVKSALAMCALTMLNFDEAYMKR
ncbi:MAG: DUF1553 domain-containing protein [Saprospiraceae bacterium]|nr:DUF1553 domain-containing protein [Saprospiraceae bacterium]